MSAPTNHRGNAVNPNPPIISVDRALSLLRILILLELAIAAIHYAVVSIHWPLLGDSTVMHYVVFLIKHGFKPYTQITDNNMPGAYYTEALAMHVFGSTDVGWRIYDYFLLATMTAALIVIALPYDWMAGAFAAGLFIVVHGAEGAAYSVEREQIIMILLLIAYALMFTAVRRRRPVIMLLMGLTTGVALSIKPTFLPLPVALLVLMACVLRRRRIPALTYLAWAILGLTLVFALDIGYLLHYHVIKPFLFILFTVSPTYASTGLLGIFRLIGLMFPRDIRFVLLPIIAITIWIVLKRRAHFTWEHGALALGFAFGLFSYFVQGKGFLHHRYTFLTLLFLLIGFALFDALRQRGNLRAISFACFALIFLWIVPTNVMATKRAPTVGAPMQLALERLGGASDLQDKVQCFDMVFGCFGALYHLDLVENTAFTGDLLFFSNSNGLAAQYYKQMFWDYARKDPATVLVISNEWFGHRDNSFDKVNVWPQFARYLAKNYTLVTEQPLDENVRERSPRKFRIYVRNGTPMLAKARFLAHSGQL
jgi:hypothetical protein